MRTGWKSVSKRCQRKRWNILSLDAGKEKQFFFHWSTLVIWLFQMLGSPADALNYSFSVTYYGSKCNTNYEGPVVSIDVPSDAIISGNMGFTMSFHALKSQYLDEKWSFEYSVKITKNKMTTQNEIAPLDPGMIA